METLDASVIATALPAIAADFNVTVVGVSLSVTAYLVAMAIFVPAAGWCADRFGARRVFAAAVGLFTLASLLCGLAPSLWTLVAARVLQGAAAAFMSPVGRIVVLRETPRARLIESMAMITWPGLIGPVIGPPLGGLIVTYVSWRWIFLLNVPIGLLGMWLILRYLPRDRATLRRPFDFKGFVLTAVALAALIQGLTHLGERQDGRLAGLAMVVVGLVCGMVSVRHALRAPAPMLDLRAARVRTFRLVTLTAGFAARLAINVAPFLLPLMFQVGFGMSPLAAGSMVLFYMAGNLAMKSATTWLLRRFGFRRVLVASCFAGSATLYACGGLSPGDPIVVMHAVLFAAGLARSLTFTVVSTLAYADVADDERAGASTLATMVQLVSMTLGVALAVFMLGASQAWHGGGALELADFRFAWFVSGTLMLLAALGTLRLSRDAGASVA